GWVCGGLVGVWGGVFFVVGLWGGCVGFFFFFFFFVFFFFFFFCFLGGVLCGGGGPRAPPLRPGRPRPTPR
ncbi:hypothetical protein PUR71_01425, partial [Streptomyces sp. SP17BM10]|uniref:hypothetical protein n=1 Tax=Streptomyces sp. SP17BM10 TaxID=3002530 RepID=UPI002E7A5471